MKNKIAREERAAAQASPCCLRARGLHHSALPCVCGSDTPQYPTVIFFFFLVDNFSIYTISQVKRRGELPIIVTPSGAHSRYLPKQWVVTLRPSTICDYRERPEVRTGRGMFAPRAVRTLLALNHCSSDTYSLVIVERHPPITRWPQPLLHIVTFYVRE